ncbi:MAG: glycosyltransferase family 39 protein [Thermoanaerobaculia bacterium]
MGKQVLSPGTMASLAGGLLLWALVAWLSPPPSDELGTLDPPARAPRWIPLGLSFAAAGVCWWQMPAEEFRLSGVLAWGAAIALWLWAWWSSPKAAAVPQPAPAGRWAAGGALAAILLAAAFFHFHELAGVPGNPVSDHAEEILDMRDLLEGRHAIYFFRNLGLPPAHFYWTATLIEIFGLPLHYLTLKIATAAFGLLTILGVYLMGRELGGAGLGLPAAALVAWGKWPFSLARPGLDYPYPVALTAFAIWLLLRYLRRGDRLSALAAGAAIGAGLYTYTPFRVVPLLVPLALILALCDRRRRGGRWRVVADGLLIAGTAASVFLPLGKFMLVGEHREFFWSRVVTRATSVEQAIAGEPLQIFLDNLGNMAKAFHWRGASTWTMLQENDPFLDVVSGGLLLAGLVLALAYVALRSWRWAWLLPAIILLTLPSTLVIAFPNENPSLNRAGPAIPVVFLLVALPFAYLARGFSRERLVPRVAGLAALAAGAVFSVQQNAHAYFVRFGASYDHLIEHSMEMAEVIKQYRARGVPISQTYLLAADFWVDARNIAFELDDPGWSDTHNIVSPKVPEGLEARPLVFLYRSTDTERFEKLRELYPGGTGRTISQTHPDRNFAVYVVK